MHIPLVLFLILL